MLAFKKDKPTGVKRIISALATVMILWAFITTVSHFDDWKALELWSFDSLSVLNAPGEVDLPITIVGIDESSFAELDLQWPWPRALHGLLIDRLKAAGAAVIGLDIVFAEPSDKENDEALAGSIRSAGNVVLASDMIYQKNALFDQIIRIEPNERFRNAGARTGLASIKVDSDMVVRRIPSDKDSFWREVVKTYQQNSPPNGIDGIIPPNKDSVQAGGMIRYLGPPHTFPYVSYYQALDPQAFLPEGVFKDRIVLIGFDTNISTGSGGGTAGAGQGDLLATPFLASSSQLSAGVEVQATLIANAFMDSSIRTISNVWLHIMTFLFLLVATLVMSSWRPVKSALWGIALIAVVAGLTYYLFVADNLWLPMVRFLLAAFAVYLVRGAVTFIAVAIENARLVIDLRELFLSIIKALAGTIEAKSRWTRGHSERVTRIAVAIGRELDLSDKELKTLEISGLLHDIGKIGTDGAILDKNGKLTDAEFAQIKKHPNKGGDILSNIKQLKDALPGVIYHHEHNDGSGYPNGLKGDEIPMIAKIISVADTADAMGADRPYRKGLPKEIIDKEMKKCSGTQFDAQVVGAYLRIKK